MNKVIIQLSLVFALSSTILFGQVTNGLQGYWPFDGNANDISGNNNNGTVNGAALAADRFGQQGMAYCFDGVDDYIVTAFAGVGGTTSRSISFWAKISSTGNGVNSGGHEIISYGDTPATGDGKSFRVTLNRNCTGMGVGIGNATHTIDNTISVYDEWHHYIVVYDLGISGQLSDISMYIDGILVPDNFCDTYNKSVVVNTETTIPIHFGRLYIAAQPRYFSGCLDEVRMYNKPLSLQEIDTLFNNANVSVENESSDKINVSVYPNPASSILNIYSENSAVDHFKIFDINGRNIYSSAFLQSSLDITKFANGIYMISFYNDQLQQLKSIKFIKN